MCIERKELLERNRLAKSGLNLFVLCEQEKIYTLISVIKDELHIAEDQALVEVMCKTKKVDFCKI